MRIVGEKRGKRGWTALHFAARENLALIVKKLVKAGAVVELQDEHGNTALFRAVFSYRGQEKR